MPIETSTHFRKVFRALKRYGILLESDAKLPSVSSIVAGRPVKGSWWAHPRAHTIFQVSRQLDSHKDATVARLVSGKITFVHRRLWPALLAVGSAREPWQLKGLSSSAKKLLGMVQRKGELRTDKISWRSLRNAKKPGEAARELERRLLVQSQEIHTSTGAHAKRLETWEHWATRAKLAGKKMKPERARRVLENVLKTVNARFGAEGRLPWESTRSK